MTLRDVGALACPTCHGPLAFQGTMAGEALARGHLDCGGCGRHWPVDDGIPRLVDEAQIRGLDRLMRFVYDRIAALHDPVTHVLLPLLQGSSEESTRDGSIRRLELGRLTPGEGRPARLLEVGVGAGANLPLLERDLPPDLAVELWGLDLSPRMVVECHRRLSRHTGRPMRLLVADAHALPFPDASFDRVFHTGGIGTYGDPRRALAEMARVARRDTPIVVVDEQLDPHRDHGLYYRLVFRALTLYDRAPRAPVAELPEGAVDVLEEQVSRFYYCLTFRMPRASRRGT